MEENVEAASKTVDLTEKDLLTSVALKEPTYTGLEDQLAKFRDACSNLIFLSWNAAALKDVETRLWNAHGRVNSKFRPFLAAFREGDGKKKHVERRKAEKLYLDFIKSSMRFYRGFIQRLASHFKNVPEVFDIARKFSLDTLSADSPVAADLDLKRMILRSCHATLIRLGDLSRYRETELQYKERNWGPAKGYYDLATALDPADGQSFNQLAVISLADNDHLRAVYYLYRALSTQKPPPQTMGNLEVEFKKVLKHHKRGEPLLPPQSNGISSDLVSSFLAYHAACYSDPDFSDHEEQRKAIIDQFAVALKTMPFDSTLRKMCMINIAAGNYAGVRPREIAKTNRKEALRLVKTVTNIQALNVATCTVLFSLLAKELLHQVEHSSAQVSPVSLRLLPLLRLYSGWLLSSVEVLLHIEGAGNFREELQGLWITYAQALSLLVAIFRISDLLDVPYLLDEDQDTVAFTPFTAVVRKLHCEGPTGSLKPSSSDAALPEPLSPAKEMLFRIKGLVKVGSHLSKHKNDFGDVAIPLVFAGGQFHPLNHDHSPRASQNSDLFDAPDQRASDAFADPRSDQPTVSEQRAVGLVPLATENTADDPVGSGSVSPQKASNSQSQSPSVRAAMSKENSRPPSSTFTAQDLVRQMQQPSPTAVYGTNDHVGHHPSLPGIWQTPFTPRPGETPGSRPGTAHQMVPSSTAPAPRLSAGREFDQQIAHLQHNIQARTSPIAPIELTQSSSYETPTGLSTFIRNQPNPMLWESSMPSPSDPATEIPRKKPQASPFGAIGEARPRSAKTPTSGQPG